jgi:type II secretory ATPase GspE/PulE/Tfp pilus assembly ATPase PilB-like protein
MSEQTNGPENQLLRPSEGSKCQPRIVHDPYPRVIDWGMPEDVNAGDFTFSILEAALEAGASEIQLTPLEEFGEVSVHFRIGSEFIRQKPFTQMQFGLIAILLAHIATLSPNISESPHLIRYFYTHDQQRYYVRFSKIRLEDGSTAILIRLFLTKEKRQSAA